MKKCLISIIVILIAMALFTACEVNITFTSDKESDDAPEKYTACTTIFVLMTDDSNTSSITTNDLMMPPEFMQEVVGIFNSKETLQEIVDKSGCALSIDRLSEMLSCENEGDTGIISINANSDDPQLSVTIADAAREVLSRKMMEILNVEAVNVVDTAHLVGN